MYHKMFLDIMKKASKSYKPASMYIHDVLVLKTEHLLCDDYIHAKETTDMMELHRDFKDHIRSFIESHNLKGSIVCRFFFDFMVCSVCRFLYIPVYLQCISQTSTCTSLSLTVKW